MAELLSIAVALPGPVVTLEDTKARIAAHIDDPATAARYQRMAESTRIARRHVVLPVDETLGLRTIDERQTHYARCAVALSEESSVLTTRALPSGSAPRTSSWTRPTAATEAEQPSSVMGTRRAVSLMPRRCARCTSSEGIM